MSKNNKKNLVEEKIGPMVTKNKLGQLVCRHPWASMDITPSGKVVSCCYLPRKVVGNVNKEGVLGVWNSEKYQSFRKEMAEKGAFKTCPRCHVLTGMKHWETLNWYKDLDKDSRVYKNARLNEEELFQGKTKLQSQPRRIKYIPNFTCNLNCYHCNQDQYRLKGFAKLDKKIFKQVMEIFPNLQVINPFGGEPFIFPETLEFMRAIVEINPACRFYTTTNANYITEEMFEMLKKIKIIKIAVSFDGFSKETYEKYRRGGSWEKVLNNLEKLAKIKQNNPFALVLNASFNNETYRELPKYMELLKKYGAVGKPVLLQKKSNHTEEFWRRHIKMSKDNLQEFKALVSQALKDKDLPIDTRNSLLDMKKCLENYPYNEFKVWRLDQRVKVINFLKKLGLYKIIHPIYKRLF